MLDMEHGVFTQDSADPLVAFARAIGFTVYVRVAEAARVPIQQALDAGADGVILPHLEGVAHAREVTGFAKYPPLGTRSVGGGRTWGYGGVPPDFARRDNRRTLCFAMVETAGALAEAEDIARLPTVDGLFVGIFDLGMSRGRGGYHGTPADHADIAAVAAAARAAGKSWGMNIYGENDCRFCRRHGVGLAAVADDHTVLGIGVSSLLTDAKAVFAANRRQIHRR
ncbi:MAG: aldolase/citrate lyase family protein [Dongiaceae bacterium]